MENKTVCLDFLYLVGIKIFDDAIKCLRAIYNDLDARIGRGFVHIGMQHFPEIFGFLFTRQKVKHATVSQRRKGYLGESLRAHSELHVYFFVFRIDDGETTVTQLL